jgi:hypothetical protein
LFERRRGVPGSKSRRSWLDVIARAFTGMTSFRFFPVEIADLDVGLNGT